MKPPTARQTEVYAAWERNGRSQMATARELGLSQGGVRSALIGYQHRSGTTLFVDEPPRLSRPPIAQRRLAAFRAEIRAEVQDELRSEFERAWNARLDRASEAMDRANALASRLEQLLSRAEQAAVPVSHRRRADGGQGGRRERRRHGAPAA